MAFEAPCEDALGEGMGEGMLSIASSVRLERALLESLVLDDAPLGAKTSARNKGLTIIAGLFTAGAD